MGHPDLKSATSTAMRPSQLLHKPKPGPSWLIGQVDQVTNSHSIVAETATDYTIPLLAPYVYNIDTGAMENADDGATSTVLGLIPSRPT